MTREPNADGSGDRAAEEARWRYRAAIDTLETVTQNLRTMRRGDFPVPAQRRISDILRLSAELQELLERELAREKGRR